MHTIAFKYFINNILSELPIESVMTTAQVMHLYALLTGFQKTFLLSPEQIKEYSKTLDEKFPPDYLHPHGWKESPNEKEAESILKQNYIMGGWIGKNFEPLDKHWIRHNTGAAKERPKSTPTQIIFRAQIKFIQKENEQQP